MINLVRDLSFVFLCIYHEELHCDLGSDWPRLGLLGPKKIELNFWAVATLLEAVWFQDSLGRKLRDSIGRLVGLEALNSGNEQSRGIGVWSNRTPSPLEREEWFDYQRKVFIPFRSNVTFSSNNISSFPIFHSFDMWAGAWLVFTRDYFFNRYSTADIVFTLCESLFGLNICLTLIQILSGAFNLFNFPIQEPRATRTSCQLNGIRFSVRRVFCRRTLPLPKFSVPLIDFGVIVFLCISARFPSRGIQRFTRVASYFLKFLYLVEKQNKTFFSKHWFYARIKIFSGNRFFSEASASHQNVL